MANGRRISGRPGTGFIGIDDWGRANADGAQSLADRLAGGVESEGQAAQQGLDNLEADFWDRVRGGTVRFDEGADAQTAGLLSSAEYGGPNGLADISGYDEAFAAADKAGQNARRLGGTYGRATALQDMAKGQDYSNGQALLDSALAGRAGGSRFAQLGQQWGGLLGRAQGMEFAAAGTAREARAISDDARQRYAARAPVARREEEQARQDQNNAYIEEVNRQTDEYERAHPETTGEENYRQRRQREPGMLNGWGGATKGGGWA